MTPHSSAAHSTGTLWRMGLMKETQAGSGLRQCSRTAPVGEVALLQERKRHLGTPAAVDPSLLWLVVGLCRLGSPQGSLRCLKGVHHGDADEASNLDQTGSDLSPLALFRPSITDCFISLYEQLICEPEDAFIVI